MSEPNAEFYQLLGVEPSCSYAAIRKAFNARLETLKRENATESEVDAVRRAFDCLNDPIARVHYNHVHQLGYPESQYSGDEETNDETNVHLEAPKASSSSSSAGSTSSDSENKLSPVEKELVAIKAARKRLAEDKANCDHETQELVVTRNQLAEQSQLLNQEIVNYNAKNDELRSRWAEMEMLETSYAQQKQEFDQRKAQLDKLIEESNSAMSSTAGNSSASGGSISKQSLAAQRLKLEQEVEDFEKQKNFFMNEKDKQIKRLEQRITAHIEEKTSADFNLAYHRSQLKLQEAKNTELAKETEKRDRYLCDLVRKTENKSNDLDLSFRKMCRHYDLTTAQILESSKLKLDAIREQIEAKEETLRFSQDRIEKLKPEKVDFLKWADSCDDQVLNASHLQHSIEKKIEQLKQVEKGALKAHNELQTRYSSKELTRDEIIQLIRNNDADEVFRQLIGHGTAVDSHSKHKVSEFQSSQGGESVRPSHPPSLTTEPMHGRKATIVLKRIGENAPTPSTSKEKQGYSNVEIDLSSSSGHGKSAGPVQESSTTSKKLNFPDPQSSTSGRPTNKQGVNKKDNRNLNVIYSESDDHSDSSDGSGSDNGSDSDDDFVPKGKSSANAKKKSGIALEKAGEKGKGKKGGKGMGRGREKASASTRKENKSAAANTHSSRGSVAKPGQKRKATDAPQASDKKKK